jgi:hypothetical protein
MCGFPSERLSFSTSAKAHYLNEPYAAVGMDFDATSAKAPFLKYLFTALKGRSSTGSSR